MPPNKTPLGNPEREAIDSLRGYVYQIYQSALAWTELESDESLYLEVAEDFAVVAKGALEAVQAKETARPVTINSGDIIATINSFVELQEKNPSLKVIVRHLTTSTIGKERKRDHRIGDAPTLLAWRNLAKAGDLSDLRRVLDESKLSKESKNYIKRLDDEDLRERFLKRIHFDCGAPESHLLEQQITSRISKLLIKRRGTHSQAQNCVANILLTLLKLSTNSNRDERHVERSGLERHLEEATQVTLNRADFETLIRLINKALPATISSETGLSSSVRPSPVAETPLPKALASRENDILQLQQILESVGLCWIAGTAGMGKTVSARVLAHKNGGDWGSINLRGQSSQQVAQVLNQAADSVKDFGLRGLIIDDLSWVMDPSVLDSLYYLAHSANRSDVLLVLNSADSPTSDFLFACNLPMGIARTLSEFTEEDIQEILLKYGVSNAHWAKYIHLVSGGGHPQLATAFIQHMVASGWNPDELQTLDALIVGAPAISEVRKDTRKRLLTDMPESTRRLIERLSLKTSGFSRELAIDLGKLEPPISDPGIVLDTLIGSWVDQLEGDRFNLSPLLSGFADNTLGTNEIEEIHSAIADSLMKKRSLDVIDMNSALFSAWISKNEPAIFKLCMAILGSDFSELEMIAPYLPMFTMFRTDTIAYPAKATISHMVRAVQVLLVNQVSNPPTKIQDALRCFSEEAKNVEHDEKSALINVVVYSKLLLQTSKAGMGTGFIDVIRELDKLLENENCVLPSETLEVMKELEKGGITAIGVMFVNQARQLTKIKALTAVFDFLESSSSELRSRLLAYLDHDDLDVDMLVTGAWLNEHDENTIDPSAHSAVFARLEKQAVRWNQTGLAVCCRKFQAIILDEYGNDKNSALAVLEEGLSMFGQFNSELVRAKAKVLHRSNDHEGSLALAKGLIESNAPLNEAEKAFLGREAAISAEKQGDFKTARRYYLFGRTATDKFNLTDMMAMRTGLLADAALASWHSGERKTCLQEFVTVLDELNKIKPDETLRTAHCHAVVRHVLLWLDQDATGDKRPLEGGEEITIRPGCVSNPAPHPKIKERPIPPIEMAWYMLAIVENNAVLDTGITDNLEQFLPRGPVREGQMLLSPAKMHKALSRLDAKLFVEALQDIIPSFVFAKEKRGRSEGLEEVTYGTLPIATKEQQEDHREMTERFVLVYCATCVLKDQFASIPVVLRELKDGNGFLLRPGLIDRLQSNGPAEDYYTRFANLILTNTKGTPEAPSVSPWEVFELAFKALEMAQKTSNYKLVAENLLPWLVQRWSFILEHQRFQLILPTLHEASIRVALEQDGVATETKVADILTATLPTLGIRNQRELAESLLTLPR